MQSQFIANNPGFGNCAFYAFAIGLIDIIQREFETTNETDLFDQWSKLDPSIKGYLGQILGFQYKKEKNGLFNLIPTVTYSNQQEKLLLKLQESLRKIYFDKTCAELTGYINQLNELKKDENNIDTKEYNELVEKISGMEIFLNFSTMVYGEIGEKNYLTDSKEVLKFAKETDKTDILKVFCDDFLSEKSVIKKAFSKVSKNNYWGTDSDLNKLGEIFNVQMNYNLHSVFKTSQIKGGERPYSMTLNNHSIFSSNRHWTTTISINIENDPFLDDKTLKKYNKYARSGVLDKKEIRDIFKSYLNSYKNIFQNRRYVAEAKKIVAACEDKNKSAQDVMSIINDYSINFENQQKSFFSRVHYIQKRAAFQNQPVKKIKSIKS